MAAWQSSGREFYEPIWSCTNINETSPITVLTLIYLMLAVFAGCLAWASVYPLDVIKSRMQAHPSHLGPGAWMRFGTALYAEGGAASCYRGLTPTLSRAFVMDAVTFAGYTNVMRWLSGGPG